MSRSSLRTLVAAVMVASVVLATGCSLIPGLGDSGTPAAPPAAPAADPASKPATTTPSKSATTTPVVSKTTSGTAVPIPVPKTTKVSSDIDGIELRELQGKGALVVDLQQEADFKREHIDDAVNVPVDEFVATASKWDRDRVVVLYDRSGAQSQGAQNWMQRAGFTHIYHLFRGMAGYDAELVGTDPKPIPPRMPVLYYFYASGSSAQGIALDMNLIGDGNVFAKNLKDEFGDRFEYHRYDISTVEGLSRFLEFDGGALPMFRLVDEKGRSEQFTGTGTFMTVRSHLQRAIEAHEAAR